MIFKIHHLNCATLCPVGGKLVNHSPAKLVCHCLLIESSSGLILVDTALGTNDVLNPTKKLSIAFRLLGRPALDLEETALKQIEKLGFSKADVRHIILTHLDLDHAGGLSDFPHAKVHLFAPEFEAATSPINFVETLRYHSTQWAHKPHWVLHKVEGEAWFGFNCVRQLSGLPPEILLVPLAGHTRGHCGVAIESPYGTLLHAGDAYYFHQEMNLSRPRGTLGLNLFQRIMEADRNKRIENQARLRALIQNNGDEVKVFCAHDPTDFERMSTKLA